MRGALLVERKEEPGGGGGGGGINNIVLVDKADVKQMSVVVFLFFK